MGPRNEEKTTKSQLSLFEYKLPHAEFSEANEPDKSKLAEIPRIRIPYAEPQVNRTPRFVSLSAIFHGLAMAAVTFLMIPAHQDLKVEPITIEISDLSGAATLGSATEATKGGDISADNSQMPLPAQPQQSAAAPVAAEEVIENVVKETKAPSTVKPKVAEAPKTKPVQAKAEPKAAPAKVAAASPTIDDIATPELEADTLSSLAEAPSADLANELDSNFKDIEQAHNEKLENEKASLSAIADQAQDEQAQNFADIEKANAAEKQHLEEKQEELRQKNATALAVARQKEEDQRIAAEQQAAALLAAQEQANEQDPSSFGEAANSAGSSPGLGQGNHGAATENSQLAGSPTGLRSLEQLRQMPGNPRPQYDRLERRRGDQGQVAFAAYISKDGYPTQFKLLKSTGYRNLDGKTLAALKKWRFHPGQEGWVELPFRWDLKGGVQQDGGLLRRSAQGY